MRLRKKYKICGLTFTVERVDCLCCSETSQKLLGLCDVNKCKIYLEKSLKGEKLVEVFVHEVTHAILENLNINLKEDQVNILGLNFLSFIRDNKIVL